MNRPAGFCFGQWPGTVFRLIIQQKDCPGGFSQRMVGFLQPGSKIKQFKRIPFVSQDIQPDPESGINFQNRLTGVVSA